jgi:hypothetical protein
MVLACMKNNDYRRQAIMACMVIVQALKNEPANCVGRLFVILYKGM